MIPIGKEWQHVELYVRLQNMRFEDKISFILAVLLPNITQNRNQKRKKASKAWPDPFTPAKVLQDQGSSVKLTGLGLPSEMAEYIGDDDAHSCPYMFLWNPIDLGRLGAYTPIALVNGDATAAAGEKFTAGDMGEYEIVTAGDGGTEIILGAPFKFDPSNIEEWKSVY